MSSPGAARFYAQDIVRRIGDTSSYGVVVRCWQDGQDDAFSTLPFHSSELFSRPLNRGEIGIAFNEGESHEIHPESAYELLDRPMQAGDICKRNHEDVQSAMVLGVDVKFKVSHAISGKEMEEWKTIEDIESIDDVKAGDYVIYDDWIGQIQEYFDVTTVQTSNGSLCEIPEISEHLLVGHRGRGVLPETTGDGIPRILSYFLNAPRPSPNDVVVSVNHIGYAISWSAINQRLPREEAEARRRPKRFWFGSEISELIYTCGVIGQTPRVGNRVTLKNTPDEFVTTHGQGSDHQVIKVDTFNITETATTAEILWQDGSKEYEKSTNLFQYLNPDEFDCWPGDHVIWRDMGRRYAAVVQRVNAKERTAEILLSNGHQTVASVLDLELRSSDTNFENSQTLFGVSRGDFVFIHNEGTTNGNEIPLVPSIGEIEHWAHDPPYEDDGKGRPVTSGWRMEFDKLGKEFIQQRGVKMKYSLRHLTPDDDLIDWIGEVTDLKIDGIIEVAFPNLRKILVPLERLTRLNDDIEHLEGLWADGDLNGNNIEEFTYDGHQETQGEEGRWMIFEGGDEDDLGDADSDVIMASDSSDIEMSSVNNDVTVPGAWPTDERDEDMDSIPRSSSRQSIEAQGISNTGGPKTQEPPADDLQESSWSQFNILPSAPIDHAFFSTPVSQPSRQFTVRLAKEYRVLASSLPESIIVQTYEDRVDLLRSLIIGPSCTPYEDAPFVIDWKLGDDYQPPTAHFYSWTVGNGRVNPNLYEEGKVCLSILGTWAGDRSESWNPSGSSLLQALVSIQGLVLVKEPYYCEPVNESLKGTEDGKVNSRLYSERAYVLSRGFVRFALETPLSGLEDVIRDIYIKRGKLKKVIESAHVLIELSKTTKEADTFDSDLAIPHLTAGAIIPLSRTLDRLESILSSPS